MSTRNKRRKAHPRRRLRRFNQPEAVLELVEYEITDEPMSSPDDEQLAPEDRERLMTIAEQVVCYGRAGDYVQELEQFVLRYPRHRQACNFLMAAYEAVGRREDAEAMIRTSYERFPRYLFAVTNYCLHLIRERREDEVPGVLGNNFAIHRFCGRKRFHVTEFTAWHGMLANYFLAIGDCEVAERCVKAVESMGPDHPSIAPVKALLKHPLYGKLLKAAASFMGGRRSASSPPLPKFQR